MPNTILNESNVEMPRYLTDKTTQTEQISRSSGASINTAMQHSTPVTPRLTRRRSLSLGSLPTSAVKGLFPAVSPIKPSQDSNKSPNSNATQGRSGDDNSKGEKSKNKSADIAKSQKRKYSQALIDICAEFDRQDQELKAMHQQNKEDGRYHLCPKLNFESTTSSDNEIALTDRSCNSTCACQKDKTSNTETSATNTTAFSTSRFESSSYLDISTASTAKDSPPTDKQQKKDASMSATKEKKAPGVSMSTMPSVQYYTQIRPPTVGETGSRTSPEAKLCNHLRDVNQSGADLDATLIPDNCAIVFNPEAKYPVTLELSDDYPASPAPITPNKTTADGENAAPSPCKVKKSGPISPGQFYKVKPWKKQ